MGQCGSKTAQIQGQENGENSSNSTTPIGQIDANESRRRRSRRSSCASNSTIRRQRRRRGEYADDGDYYHKVPSTPPPPYSVVDPNLTRLPMPPPEPSAPPMEEHFADQAGSSTIQRATQNANAPNQQFSIGSNVRRNNFAPMPPNSNAPGHSNVDFEEHRRRVRIMEERMQQRMREEEVRRRQRQEADEECEQCCQFFCLCCLCFTRVLAEVLNDK